MAKGKAVKVPIAILHRLVYSEGYRLDSLPEVKEPEKPYIITVPNPIRTVASDPMSRYQLKFFYKIEKSDMMICRACGEGASNAQQRAEHNLCYQDIASVVRALWEDRQCVICDKQIVYTDGTLATKWGGIPVCGADCMALWAMGNPACFEFELDSLYRNGLGKRNVGSNKDKK